ncbi:MAG TPA: CvpA family protein, partial [Verrucomicrobiae bacterium]|nr:CvpA family protein [Verrucomicrobiae bacterium]
MGSTIGMGYRQGAIRATISFFGILIAALLAGPLGHLFKLLLRHMTQSQLLVWSISPIIAFVVLMILFKVGAHFVHHKIEMFYKYKAGDLRLSLWERLNHRLGACVGTMNGTAYMILISFLLFNFTYWTVQIAPGSDESKMIRLANKLGRDLESTGMSKVAKAVVAMPESFYKLADLAGLICQNPQLSPRLTSYPAFLSLMERDDVKSVAADADLSKAWQSHASLGDILNNNSIKATLQNHDLVDLIYGIVNTNREDLSTYLTTGKSPKYGSINLLGRWDFNVGVSLAMLREGRPNIPPREFAALRYLWNQAYSNTVFVTASDGQAFMDGWPVFKSQPNQPPTPESQKGSWSADDNDTNYTVQLSSGGNNKSYVGIT